MKNSSVTNQGVFTTSVGNAGSIYRITVNIDPLAETTAIPVVATNLQSSTYTLLSLPAAQYVDAYSVRTKMIATPTYSPAPLSTDYSIEDNKGINLSLTLIDQDGDPIYY